MNPFSQISTFLAGLNLPSNPVSFSQPLFLLALPLVAVFWFVAQRERRRPRGPWPLVLWLRVAMALLIVLALAGLRLPAKPKSIATIFVVDLSQSVPADIQEASKTFVRQALQKAGPDDLTGIVTFGEAPRVELPLGRSRDHQNWGAPPPGSATNLGAALQLAADLLPPVDAGPLRRIVVLSDGNETRGDAQRDLLRPQLRDVEVAVLALPARLQDTAITSFAVPPAVRHGEPVELRVTIYSPAAQDARLKLFAEGASESFNIFDQTIRVDSGATEKAVFVNDLEPAAWSFRAELEVGSDSLPENNTSWGYTIVGDPARVLLVEGSGTPVPALRAALEAGRMIVETTVPGRLPLQPAQLAPYETIFLSNVHAAELGTERQQALRDAVANYGRGLVVIGGESTFGLGEYADTPLEEALPVTVQPPDKDQSASLALVLVVDRSGSMSATDTGDRRASRMDLAKEGAIQAVETVQEGDQVGVIAFDYDARWISDVKLIRTPADTRSVADRIATIQPDGGTDIYRAMELAYRGLQQVQARVKHVIVLTDGEQGSPAPFPTLVNSMRRAGITVSTLGIGSTGSAAATLQSIARQGQGRYYVTNNARDVPRIMTQEARMAGRSFKQERDFKPRLVSPAPSVRGLVPADFPELHGYVRVSPKTSAETILTSDQEETILAQWQFGLGRALVWTADGEGAWSKDWVGTDQFKQLWQQAARWTMPAPIAPGLQVQVREADGQAHVRVESMEPTGEFRNHLATAAEVAYPDNTGRRITLSQSAPGRYEGRFPVPAPGVYFYSVTQRTDTGEEVARHVGGYAVPQLAEFRLAEPNRVLLERLASETGGPLVRAPQEAWRRDTVRKLQPQDVWSYLIMAALLLFVLDVAVRRVKPSIYDLADARQALRQRVADIRLPRVPLPAFKLHPIQGGKPR
ncbi:MAG TPA: VWA domain-containing protein [Chloroflexota bacterium]|nr:VWA domain-containing protein [Chloroflexota bacterium]